MLGRQVTGTRTQPALGDISYVVLSTVVIAAMLEGYADYVATV